MESKFKGIDSREIKCCSENTNSIEAGISFEKDEGVNVLRFHFLDYIAGTGLLHQQTKAMHLNKHTRDELITLLKQLDV